MCDKWLDIESAPKDGTVIVARQGEWAPCHLYWEDGGWKGVEYEHTIRPTHWLPTPPEVSS